MLLRPPLALLLKITFGTLMVGAFVLAVGCATRAAPPPGAANQATGATKPFRLPPPAPPAGPVVMLGIDVLEAQNFAPVAGKKIGLLTHAAGVNRLGVSTVEVLRRARNVRLVSLFAPEHGLYSAEGAGKDVADTVDRRSGLPIYSLHGVNRRPTPAQLKGLDALLIDLQDIGVRSYTYNVVMRYAMEACFLAGVEVVVLDRPNPLGGLKVDGPLLDREWMSGVGAFCVPYVHGLTLGELARMAKDAPGVLAVPDKVRARGRLTVIPMRGWRRSMRWPETGLTYVPTSPYVQDFAAVMGYAMVGLGCEQSGFTHGIGRSYPFRGLSFRGRTPDQLIKDLAALKLPGLNFVKVSAPNGDNKPTTGVYVEVIDWDDWRPTELSFYLMRLACRYAPQNPYAKLSPVRARTLNIHVGSTAWWNALKRDGARVDVEGFLRNWRAKNLIFQQQSRKYWLYQ
ncbi:MAG: DUF1343 domain-containing protein [Opitutaceae bacterium]|nr:DUF1343 domain-containing protein [Opitutaceae bacterium]